MKVPTLGMLAAAATAVMLAAPFSAAAEDKPHWDYSGKGEPSKWGELSDEYKACSGGVQQSPIDIRKSDALKAPAPSVSVKWQSFTPEIFNNGHTIQVNANGSGGYAELDGKRYQLLQYHFHHLSEHTVDGKHAKMEVHFVHQSEAGDLLVIGALIEEGEANAAIADVWSRIPTAGKKVKGASALDPAAMMPAKQGAFRYKGSLTTPPCSEVVTWHVMAEPTTASADQIAAFAKLYPDNFRPIQGTNRRYVLSVD